MNIMLQIHGVHVSKVLFDLHETIMPCQMKKRVMKFQSCKRLFWEAHGVLLDPVRLEESKKSVYVYQRR